MKEYKVTARKGFDSKEFYTRAESAEQLQQEVEEKMGFEINMGMTYTIEPLDAVTKKELT